MVCDQGRGKRNCELKLWFRDRGRQPLTAPHDVWFEVMVSRLWSPTIEAPTWCVTMVTIIRQYNSMKMNNMSCNIRAWSMTIVVFSFNVSTQLESMVVFITYGEGMDVKSQDYWTSMRKTVQSRLEDVHDLFWISRKDVASIRMVQHILLYIHIMYNLFNKSLSLKFDD